MVSWNLFSLFQQSKLLFKLKLACLSVLGGVQHISSQINKYDNVEIYQWIHLYKISIYLYIELKQKDGHAYMQ